MLCQLTRISKSLALRLLPGLIWNITSLNVFAQPAKKESINNITKYYGADKVTVSTDFNNGLNLSNADNGKGIAIENKSHFDSGLKIMQYRVKQVGGEGLVITG